MGVVKITNSRWKTKQKEPLVNQPVSTVLTQHRSLCKDDTKYDLAKLTNTRKKIMLEEATLATPQDTISNLVRKLTLYRHKNNSLEWNTGTTKLENSNNV